MDNDINASNTYIDCISESKSKITPGKTTIHNGEGSLYFSMFLEHYM